MTFLSGLIPFLTCIGIGHCPSYERNCPVSASLENVQSLCDNGNEVLYIGDDGGGGETAATQ